MKAFPVEARAADHRCVVWVTERGGYVFAVFQADDHTKLVHGSDLNKPLTSIDDLVAESWPWLDLERDSDTLRAIRAEGHSRRFSESQRRILDRIAI